MNFYEGFNYLSCLTELEPREVPKSNFVIGALRSVKFVWLPIDDSFNLQRKVRVNPRLLES